MIYNVSRPPMRGPLAGFTVEQLMKDARYRLSAALHTAGLHGTAAARMALVETKIAGPRRDTFGSYDRR